MPAAQFRLLGLAFAAADLLFEVDEKGLVSFAAGAGQKITGQDDAELIGRPWGELFTENDRPVAEALLAGLEDGERRGPVDLGLADLDRRVSLCAFRLPQLAPRVSCALTLSGRLAKAGGGLLGRADFEAAASNLIDVARADGLQLELSLVELGGLQRQRGALSAELAAALDRRVSGALRAESFGDAAADLGEQRFAVLRKKGEAPEAVARRLSRVLGAALEPSAHGVHVDALASPGRMMRALRFSLDKYLADGAPPQAATLSDVVGLSVEKTVAQAGAFGALVRERRFKLVYQPVISLVDGAVHHHEVLVRFEGDRSPFAMIRMAEELDLIEHLDRAIAEEAAAKLRADRSGRLRLAANVSGRTIVSPGFIEGVAGLARGGDLAGRLMFEVTESAAIDDLPRAQRHIAALQDLGFKVCLDDFGAGASSFAYLRQLNVDVVKIDGAYVRELTSSGRDDAMIRHLVGLCRELKVDTVAEMVETQAVEDVLRRAGVDYAQGWLYGQAAPQPVFPAAGPVAARRRGAVESWG
ncbi:EAL domain-containing protein [Phenylobacterium montanum]|uniref:EAL domain-containing protein n=1 Tax=Phenylobacterium montanum TaxID=2823693 RepID=A0A975FZK2_9CAUL|nr:EAL domain-containing protein [Caulobacter sp. S6]QUD87849.1 EAL domain-containing protein [Caulobacter sp. S6]